MQSVTFKCGHCNSLMAVGAEFVGRQVRCPHCQQVVVAPTAPQMAAAPVADSPANGTDVTALLPPLADDPADIFADDHTDDIFGRPAPRLELPPPRDTTVTLESRPVPLEGPPPTDVHEAPAPGAEVPDWMKESGPDRPAATAAPPARGRSLGMLLFISLVFMPLVLYSVLVTIVAILTYLRVPDPPKDPREYLNDPVGDHPGSKKLKTSGQPLETTIKFATLPLPDKLRIKIGESLTLGDLQVKANGVERCEIQMTTKKDADKPEVIETVRLRLHLTNVSKDTAFYPMDGFFDRKWREGPNAGHPPLTVLLAGDELRLFGGPAVWNLGPQSREDNPDRRYYISGNNYDTELKPGKEMDTFVCVDGDSHGNSSKWKDLLAYKGKLVWHVHIRRGSVRWKEHDYSATAVFGVEFTDQDIKQPD